MLGGARPDESRWRGEMKSPVACVSVPRSSQRRQYFYFPGKHLGECFQFGRKRMEIEAILLSPRRICLRLIIHGRTDHGFGCVVGAID